ncbi:MAG TPA: copper resistance CopC family protein [Mycobacterium sp.]|nr:copper resistance CopC family protein [Mycobacterium sp.]
MARLAHAAAVGMLLTVMLFAGTGVAAAHAVLVSTDPAAGAALPAGPGRVSATFNERLQTTFAAMTVVGPDRHLWSTGDTRVDGPVASVAVRPLGPAGTYTVNYRVTSADGHVVAGSWSFDLTTPDTGQPGPPVAPTGEAGPAGPAPEPNLPLWPFAVGAILLVGAGLWLARPKS